MTFHMPDVREALALVVIAFVGGFAWAAGSTAWSWLQIQATKRRNGGV